MGSVIFHPTCIMMAISTATCLILLGITIPFLSVIDEKGSDIPERQKASTNRTDRRKELQKINDDFDEFNTTFNCGKCILPEVDEMGNEIMKEHLKKQRVIAHEKHENMTAIPWTGIDDDDVIAMREASQKKGVRFVNRLEWGAKPPKFESPKNEIPAEVLVLIDNPEVEMCNTTQKCMDEVRRAQIQDMETYHLSDIANNFLMGNDGFVYVGRGWMRKARMPITDMKQSNKSLYIKFLGPLSYQNSSSIFEALYKLFDFGMEHHKISKNYTIVLPHA